MLVCLSTVVAKAPLNKVARLIVLAFVEPLKFVANHMLEVVNILLVLASFSSSVSDQRRVFKLLFSALYIFFLLDATIQFLKLSLTSDLLRVHC